MHTPELSSICVAGLLAVAVFGCSDGTAPSTAAPLEIVSGAGQADTVGALLDEPLTVVVRDESGRPAAGVTVTFGSPCGSAWCYVHPVDEQNVVRDTLQRATDRSGRASVRVRLGTVSGPATLAVATASESAEAEFEIQPGQAVRVEFTTAPRAVYLGEPTAVKAQAVDCHGNAREDPIEYRPIETGQYTITPAGVLTGVEYGITHLDAYSGDIWGQHIFGIVPQGEFAAGGTTLRLTQMDGTEQWLDMAAPAHWPDWRPDGRQIVFSAPEADGERLFMVPAMPSAFPMELIPPAAVSFQHARRPRYSRDGAWIWFEASTDGERAGEIWRVRSDGSQLERVGTQSSPTEGDVHPDPSPDGTRVVFRSNRGTAPGELVVRTIATGEERSLGVIGAHPAWSPDGEWIAYASPTGHGVSEFFVYLIRPDGTAAQRLSRNGWAMREGTIDWSPDQKWLLITDTGGAELLEVATGRWIWLPSSEFRTTSSAWRP